MLIETTVVGSYPQPRWLIYRDRLGSKVPRVRAPELWKVEQNDLEEAQDDATLIAIRDMERAGLDIITDGEMRRESYSNRFATALEGVDIENPGTTINRSGGQSVVPRIVGSITRKSPIEVRDVEFLRRNTAKKIKITLPGPFTMMPEALDPWTSAAPAHDQGYQEGDQEQEEQHLGDPRGSSGNAAEAEDRRHDGDDEESNCPAQHDELQRLTGRASRCNAHAQGARAGPGGA